MFGGPSPQNKHDGGLPKEEEPVEQAQLYVPSKVEQYRQEELEKAGYSELHASILALRRDVDLHQAVDLVKELGCDPDTAFRIVS